MRSALPRSSAYFLAIVLLGAIAPAPALAQKGEDIGFAPVPQRTITIADFADAQVDDLIKTLDGLLARQTDTAKWVRDSRLHFWRFVTRLQTGRLSAAQEERIVTYLGDLEKKHPEDTSGIGSVRRMVRERMIGKVAPEIIGKDYDGVEFKLSDYRGKVTVLYFTGQWCGPCRGEYPYERLMLEVHKKDPFAIVSVNSDSSLEVAKKAKVDNLLEFRSWWDGHAKKSTEGPIATAWAVTGWPAIYVLDAKGVIRFAQLRHEDILKAVSQLLEEQRKAEAEAKKAAAGSPSP
jgi:thiol-disulfide isomerase/thioredoxin